MQSESFNKKQMTTRAKLLYMGLILLGLYALILIIAYIKIFAFRSVAVNMDNMVIFTGLAGAVFGMFITLIVYGYMNSWHINLPMRKFFAMTAAMLFGYILCICVEDFNPYYMPLMFTAFLLISIVDKRDVLMCNIVLNTIVFITVYFEHDLIDSPYRSLDFVVLLGFGLTMGAILAYYLSGAVTRISFFVRSFILGIINVELMYLVSLLWHGFDFASSLLALSIINFGQIIIAIALQPVFESLFGLLTNAKLRELTDHSAPLLKRLIVEAPGTFNHCLSVASLAEVCAVAIGESALLTKACAYYHDIGKLTGPMYFAENQSAGENPHDNMLPEVSADILRKHTTFGYELCKSYKIPDEIAEITIQHHGTLPMILFYNKAKQLTDSDVDIRDYCYKGVTPRSKIAAIIMICDASEAAIRSMGKPTAEQVDKLLNTIIRDRIDLHQFDECDITLKDLEIIKETIKSAYGGLVHSRVRYPEGDVKK